MRRTIWHEVGAYKARLIDLSISGFIGYNVHLKTALNDSGQLSLVLPYNHPETQNLNVMASELAVYEDDTELWRGRITNITRDLYGMVSITAKGVLDYLHDGVLSPFTYSGTARKVLNDILYDYNKKPSLGNHKKFSLGAVSMDSEITYELKSRTTAWDAIKTLLRDYGGYLTVSKLDTGLQIQWLKELTHVCSQALRIGENIVSATTKRDSASLCTVLYGYGKNGLDFADVNGGTSYITDAAAVQKYGWIEGVYTNSQIEDSGQLLAETRREMADRIESVQTVEIKAADLADLRDDAERLQVGYLVRCKLPDFDAEQTLQIKELDWYPFELKKTSMSVGAAAKTLSKLIGG